MTTLRTVEETVRNTEFFECFGGFVYLLTQDRLAISTALVEALESEKYENITIEGVPLPKEYQMRNKALTEAQNIIRTLLESK